MRYAAHTFDGGIIFIHKVVLTELDGESRLSDTATTDDHKLQFSQKF